MSIEERIAAILAEHGWHEWRTACCCGYGEDWYEERHGGRMRIYATEEQVDAHIASVLISRLGITGERKMFPDGPFRRYVTSWEPE